MIKYSAKSYTQNTLLAMTKKRKIKATPYPSMVDTCSLPHMAERVGFYVGRRGRDSNPRYLAVYLLSKQAH